MKCLLVRVNYVHFFPILHMEPLVGSLKLNIYTIEISKFYTSGPPFSCHLPNPAGTGY